MRNDFQEYIEKIAPGLVKIFKAVDWTWKRGYSQECPTERDIVNTFLDLYDAALAGAEKATEEYWRKHDNWEVSCGGLSVSIRRSLWGPGPWNAGMSFDTMEGAWDAEDNYLSRLSELGEKLGGTNE